MQERHLKKDQGVYPQFYNKETYYKWGQESQNCEVLPEFIAVENTSFAKVNEYSLRKLLFIANQD